MVFSISFLDVIASALGAILILFIIQYNKTQTARTEAVVSEARHSQCTAALAEFARQDPRLAAATPFDDVTSMPFDRTARFEHEKHTEHPHPEEPAMAPLSVVPKAPMNVSPIVRVQTAAVEPGVPGMQAEEDLQPSSLPQAPENELPPAMSENPADASPEIAMAEPVPQEDRRVPSAEKRPEEPRPDVPMSPAAEKEAPPPEKAPPEKAEKRILPELPAGHEGKTLATCVTARENVVVRFWDHDQPDGDTIMVSWNGRNMTRIRLEEKSTTGYVFPLARGRYNIVVIKNISNGFYPLNTASVSISGCGQARWKIRDVGDSRVIYIYRE